MYKFDHLVPGTMVLMNAWYLWVVGTVDLSCCDDDICSLQCCWHSSVCLSVCPSVSQWRDVGTARRPGYSAISCRHTLCALALSSSSLCHGRLLHPRPAANAWRYSKPFHFDYTPSV